MMVYIVQETPENIQKLIPLFFSLHLQIGHPSDPVWKPFSQYIAHITSEQALFSSVTNEFMN